MADITLDRQSWRRHILNLGVPIFAVVLLWAIMGNAQFLQALNLGLPQGSVIALIAIGYSMVYGIIQLINFAHGEVFMLSAYLMLMFFWTKDDFPVRVNGAPLWVPTVVALLLAFTTFVTVNTMGGATLALRKAARRIPVALGAALLLGVGCYLAFLDRSVVAIVAASILGVAVAAIALWILRARDVKLPLGGLLGICAAVGVVGGLALYFAGLRGSLFLSALAVSVALTGTIGITLDTIAYKPLRTAPRLIPLITAIGMSIFFQALARVVWGPDPASFPPDQLPAMMQPPDRVEIDGELKTVTNEYLYSLPMSEQMAVGNSIVFRLSNNQLSDFFFLTEEDAAKAAAVLRDQPDMYRVDLDVDFVSVRYPLGTHTTESLTTAIEAAGVEIDFSDSDSAAEYFRVQLIDLVLIGLTLGVFTMLQVMIHRTKLGKAMRACSQDKTTARLVGVNVDLVVGMTFFIGSMLAAAVAPLYVVKYALVRPDMGLIVGILAFASAVLGGIGNIKGAMVGGMIIGIVYNFVPSLEYIDQWAIVTTWKLISPDTAAWLHEHIFAGLSQWRLGFAYGVMILVIIIKPTGLFGRASAHRA